MPRAEPQVIYARKPVSRRMWQVPGALWVLSTAGLLAVAPGGFTSFNVVVAAVAPGMVFGVWMLTLYSMNRYGAITLTHDTLRVGRDHVRVADIEPQWVGMLARRADPGLAQRLGTSATTLQPPGSAQADADRGRLLGGAYGTTLGHDLVTLELRRDGVDRNSRVSVPTKDRRGLLAALLTAVGEPPTA